MLIRLLRRWQAKGFWRDSRIDGDISWPHNHFEKNLSSKFQSGNFFGTGFFHNGNHQTASQHRNVKQKQIIVCFVKHVPSLSQKDEHTKKTNPSSNRKQRNLHHGLITKTNMFFLWLANIALDSSFDSFRPAWMRWKAHTHTHARQQKKSEIHFSISLGRGAWCAYVRCLNKSMRGDSQQNNDDEEI